MPTFYSSLDLINKVILQNSFTNASNIGGPDPNVNLSGSLNDNAFSMPGTVINQNEGISANYELQYDINHASPPSPVPTNAVITKVIITMQTSIPASSGSASVTFANEGPPGFSGGSVTAGCAIAAEVLPTPINQSLGTLTQIIGNQSNNSTSGTGLKTANASLNPAAVSIGFVIDYTTNPGGLYPGGHATYVQFIADFAKLIFVYSFSGSGQAQWLSFSPINHPTPATGTVTASGTLTVNNFLMEVDWNVPLAWTISPTTLNVPSVGNTITISRPNPGLPPDQDTGILSSVTIGGKKITPNDPWVVLWTTLTIIIHIPPNTPSGIGTIFGEVIGTTFSGEVSLGSLTVNYADLSGIYTFDTTVHTDQLYTRTTTSSTVTTQLVMIPAPFFVTAFFHDEEEEVMHYTGIRMRVTGQGNLKQVMQSLDTIYTEQLADLPLLTANATQPFILSNFVNQDAALRVYMMSTSDYMAVSKLIIYMRPIFSGYPQ